MIASKPNDCSFCEEEAQVLFVKCNTHSYRLCSDCLKDKKCPSCQDNSHTQRQNITSSNKIAATDISKSAAETRENENLDASGTLLFRPQDRLNQENAEVEPSLMSNRQQSNFIQRSMEATFKRRMYALKLSHERTKNELRNAEARCQQTEEKKQGQINAIKEQCRLAIENITAAFQKEKSQLMNEHQIFKEKLEGEVLQLMGKSRQDEKNASERYSQQLRALKLKFMEETEKAKQNFKALKQDMDKEFSLMAAQATQSQEKKQRIYAEFELTVKELKKKANEDSQLINSLKAQNEKLSQAKEISQLQNLKLHDIISEINKKSYKLVGERAQQNRGNENVRDSQQETMQLTKQAKIAQLSDLEGLNTKEVHFQSIADKVNGHLIEQFKFLDEFYHNPPPEVIRMTQIIIQQYSELILVIKHPLLVKILEEKEAIVVNYINRSMNLCLSDLQALQIKEIFTLQSENGLKVRKIMQRISLFKSLGRQRFNTALEQSFFKELCERLKTAIATHNRKIALTDKAEEKLSLMRDIEDYFEFKAFIQAQFAPFKQICAQQIAEIQETINAVFARQAKILIYLKENAELQNLQKYVERAEHLKKFIITTNRCAQFKHFKIKLEQYFRQKVEEIRQEIIGILSQNKAYLEKKLELLMEKRVYEHCFNLEKNVFKKFKAFDQILTKEENHYYNFDFSQLHHILLSFLKVLKQEKIETANRIITEEKIHAEQLRKEYESISCNVSIKYQFLLKLRIVLRNRTKTLIKMGNLSKLTYQQLQMFQEYFEELAEISKDEKMKGLQEITDQKCIFEEKAKAVLFFVEESFLQCHQNIAQFKDLQQTSKLIDRLLPFEKFLKESFSNKYGFLRKSIASRKYLKLPEERLLKQYLFEQLKEISMKRQNIVEELTNNEEEPIKDDYIEWYNSIITYLPKSKGKIIEVKMHRSIHQGINQLKEQQWAEGDFNSQKERQLLLKVSRLTSNEILAFHQLIDFHHKQIMLHRQEIINDQNARLRVAGTKVLPEFLKRCKEQEVKKTRFYKVYLRVLQNYVMSSCRNLNTNEKINYVSSLYEIEFSQMTQSVRTIFKGAEEYIYFKRLSADQIKNCLNYIVNTDEKSEQSAFIATEKIMDMFKIYAAFKSNEEKSLLDFEQRQLIHEEMMNGKQLIMKFCLDLCKKCDHENMFQKKCNRKELLLDLIKLQTCIRLMNKVNQIETIERLSNIEKDHEFICQRINTKMDRVYEMFRQFRFYQESYQESFENMQFLGLIRELNDNMLVFKELQFHIDKLKYFVKNNYLEELHLRKISYKELNRIIVMTWIWEHSKIKKEIMQMVRQNNQKETHRYQVILLQKEAIKDQDLHCFSFLAKEEYDFKRVLTAELLYIQKTIIKYISQLHLQNTSYNITMTQLKDKRNQYIKSEKEKNRVKHDRHVSQVQNSFKQMSNQQQRNKKIEIEVNSLKNQLRSYEQFLLNYDIKQIQAVRASHKKKNQLLIRKMCKNLVIINNILPIFDEEVQMICLNILLKIQQDINEFDKILKQEIIDYSKKRNEPKLKMYFEQDQRGEFTDTLIIHSKNSKGEGIDTSLLDDRQNSFLQVMRNCPEIKSHASIQPQLLNNFTQYQDQLERIQKKFLEAKSESFILDVIKDTRHNSKQLHPSILMARIFAVMATQKYIDLHQEEISLQNLYLTQVLAALLLVNNPNPERSEIENRLIKLNPGQGKSRVIAGLNCYLGLKGYEVYCGCLSMQLARRDQEAYRSLYQAFGVSGQINYSQTYTLCEYVFETKINQKVFDSIRKVLNNERIQEELPLKLSIIRENNASDRMILVIDQIDGLFDEKYFDKIYSPEILFQCPELTSLIQFVWKNRNDDRISTLTKNSQQYERLREAYSHIEGLLWNQTESLIVSSQEFNKHSYEIKKDEIVYQNVGERDRKVNFHFCKIFASCFEYQNKNISRGAYEKIMNIKMKIGEFSYADLPKYFDKIMGFSSTYEALSNFKGSLLKQDYKMKEIYNIETPNEKSNQQIVGFHSYYENQYITYLADHIQKIKKTARPIIIFFESEASLNNILNHEQLKVFQKDVYKITQNIPWQLCQYLISSAGKKRRITCTTSEFAKGINFRCDDSKIQQLGGIYVIITYIPKNQSDFVQLMGRTGRKKEKSSFQMIIKVEDMHQRQVKLYEDEKLYEALVEYWREYNAKQQARLSESIKIAQQRQKRTRSYLNTLESEKENYLNMLVPLNYTYTPSQTIKIIIAIDGTGSTSKCMENAIKSLAKCLKDIWNRTQSCIKQHKINISFEMKIMIYRNYNSRIEKIIQSSNFSRDTIELQSFASSVRVEGGFGHEAHEALFFQVGKIANKQKVNEIIIIGDSPGNSYRQMLERRKKFFGQSYWKNYIPAYSSIQEYSNVIKEKNIPINSLYILKNKKESEEWDKNVKRYYQKMSEDSKGNYQELRIEKQQSIQMRLMTFISKRILRIIGEDLVRTYNRLFD